MNNKFFSATACDSTSVIRYGGRVADLSPEMSSSWRPVATHSHMLRGGDSDPCVVSEKLLAWCRQHRMAAVGIGSPWEPISARKYEYYERERRNEYFAGQFYDSNLLNENEILEFFDDLNRRGGGTLFYLDNETPKSLHGHLWYIGFHYGVPAWHDYSQDQPVQFYRDQNDLPVNPLTGKPHRRRPYLEVVHEQRRHGALAVWAHPTSWWWDKGRFITNIAAELPTHLFADGHLDGVVVQGYDAYHRHYQELWFALLDTGATVPGFAEGDFCFGSPRFPESEIPFANYFFLPERFTVEEIKARAATGNFFVGSGGFLTLDVDGVPMGGTVALSLPRVLRARVCCAPPPGQSRVARLDLIGKGGVVLCSFRDLEPGAHEFDLSVPVEPGYLIARTFGANDEPDRMPQQEIRHMAMTNPVYLRPDGFEFRAVSTSCAVRVSRGSPWRGGQMILTGPDERELERVGIRYDEIPLSFPANAKITLVTDDREESFYPALENPLVRERIDFLALGRFLETWPNLEIGEVPVAAFGISETAEALREMELNI